VTNSRLLDFWCWLGWFGHVERKDDNDWVKRCITWEVEGIRQRGHPKKTLWDCVKNDMESLGLPKRMHSPGINGEGELRGNPANPGSPGKMAVKTEYMCVCVWCWFRSPCEYRNIFWRNFYHCRMGQFCEFCWQLEKLSMNIYEVFWMVGCPTSQQRLFFWCWSGLQSDYRNLQQVCANATHNF